MGKHGTRPLSGIPANRSDALLAIDNPVPHHCASAKAALQDNFELPLAEHASPLKDPRKY
jgi:hypothetical protein